MKKGEGIENNFSRRFELRLSEAQRETIRQAARERGQSDSEFARAAIMEKAASIRIELIEGNTRKNKA